LISHSCAKFRPMDAKTQKSELTRAAIVGAALDLAAAEGLESITLQAVADRVGLSKSGVFSRAGSREALQKAVIEEFGRRFLADVFVPAMQHPKGLPRLNEIVRRWIARTRDVEAFTGCIYTAGAFELDDREGELRDLLHSEITRWRAAPRPPEHPSNSVGGRAAPRQHPPPSPRLRRGGVPGRPLVFLCPNFAQPCEERNHHVDHPGTPPHCGRHGRHPVARSEEHTSELQSHVNL